MAPEQAAQQAAEAPKRPSRLRAFVRRHPKPFLFAGGLLVALWPVLVFWGLHKPPVELTQDDLDDAVIHTLETKSLPSRTAKAADAVRQAVVRVRGVLTEDDDEDEDPKAKEGKDGKGAKPKDKDASAAKGKDAPPAAKGKDTPPSARGKDAPKKDLNKDQAKADPKVGPPNAMPGAPGAKGPPGKDGKKADGDKKAPPGLHQGNMSIGSGVVIVDKGVILTNMHVVNGAKRIFVTFFDGMESEADLIGAFPDNDLAVLQARRIPDDLPAATLGSSKRLKPGEEVVAVGFPFDIGPSVSAGVVSGLNREFRSPNGDKALKNLIQFDAAANSGNSGGPLVTMDGEVVGIVTAILNPHGAGTFIGIGFAVTIEGAGMAVGIPPF